MITLAKTNKESIPIQAPAKITLEATGLQKIIGNRTIVNGVDINVSTGEVVGLLGPNGAGKTTSFYMMVGLIKADNGKVTLMEKDITADPIHVRARKGIGYLPQEASVFRDLSVEANIYAALECTDLSNAQRESKLEGLLQELNIGHIRKSKGSQLSGGERRRVEVARTLSLSPKFILLDEPFAGIDPLAVSDLQNIIRGLKERNIGVLITDHNVRETLGIVDRAYIMSEGKLLIGGTPQEILESEVARKFYLGEEFKM
ncbi:MAG: LPS export ABC transporter ATP-binding protein [Oligoflexia bacterium]|nr:LPS export ABC transporter ATP-binding protein [Oligoflexia bacterium]MBF0364258.1 LPS export ABC transporter ATP-binding protein [Oligoflexia bacterium]